MTPTTTHAWAEALPADEHNALELMQAFYAEEHLEFNPKTARDAMRTLLASPQLGRVFLLKDTAHPTTKPLGYLALAFWHSLEFGGRVVLFDEFYIAPEKRGQGWAPRTIQMAREWARAQNAVALRLEVNHHNTRAKTIYLKSNFTDDKRDILTIRL